MQFRSSTPIPNTYDRVELDPLFPITRPIPHDRSHNQKISPHVHPCFELGFCYEGSGLCVVEHQTFPYQAGSILFVPEGELHIVVSSPGVVSRWAFTNFDPAPLLAGLGSEKEPTLPRGARQVPRVVHEHAQPDLCAQVRFIMEDLLVPGAISRTAVQARLWLLSAKLTALRPHDAPASEAASPEGLSRLRPALEYIAARYTETISLRALADGCGMSISHFRRLFLAHTGLTPLPYLVRFRLRAAAVLLKQGKRPIVEIAAATGFETLSSFNRHFRNTYGLAPRAWRRQMDDRSDAL